MSERTQSQPLVLVVEDEPLVRLDIALAFVDAGFSVIEVPDAEGAVELLDSGRHIGLIFTDVELQGDMNGLELAGLVKSRWPQIPVLITSGRVAVTETAGDCFIPKPYEPRAVISQARELAA